MALSTKAKALLIGGTTIAGILYLGRASAQSPERRGGVDPPVDPPPPGTVADVPVPTPPAGTQAISYRITGEDVVLRGAPSASGRRIHAFERDIRVVSPVPGDVRNGYRAVVQPNTGRRGWISTQYLADPANVAQPGLVASLFAPARVL